MNRGKGFLFLLLAIVALLVVGIVRPFLEYVLLGLILAYVLFPIHGRLVAILNNRFPTARFSEPLSALGLILASLVAIILPLLYVFVAFLGDLQVIYRGESNIETALIESKISEYAGAEINLEEGITLVTEWIFAVFFGDVSGLFASMLHVSLGIALLLFLVFYLLIDGPALVAWLTEASPLSPSVSQTLIDQIDRTTWGAVVGHAFAAVVQALVAGVGFYLVGISNVVFWTIVMVILAFLPLIGVFIVWAPAAVYLYLIDEPTAAMFLAAYGLIVVSFIDYYVRPIVIDKRARINPAAILVGVFGGVYTLGFVGLFVGPILIGVLVAIIETYRTEYHNGQHQQSTAGAVATPDPSHSDSSESTASFDATDEQSRPLR
ncbi:AI-2E family transporter [Natronolimnobius sp. AArcel1]|uniref:AI-2E family transporter n=1 Tax=Natronolimnobius sp. AArcel1 TaxID=1679093 RepID=UPI0013EB2314|nr:AI-2E family transporter [Natronolimnobius sp. AArcel1]NGM69559.1 AI-2E family transporter [Natronolimnobius sp. AArcel1]